MNLGDLIFILPSFLLSIYFVFKGKELLLLAQALPEAERASGLRSAKYWFFASIIIGSTGFVLGVLALLSAG